MSDSITQLTLWETPEQPEFSARIRHTQHNNEDYWSLVDIMREFATSENEARKYWNDTKKRLKRDGFDVSENIRQLKLTAPDGKLRSTDCANAETCLRIVQSIPSPKAESIRQWLAQVGKERIEETADPEIGVGRAQQRAIQSYQRQGKDDQWIATRLKGIDDRKAFTDALSRHVVDMVARDYATATNTVYTGLWGRDAATLKAQIGLSDKANLRDFQPQIASHYQGIVESSVALMLGEAQTATIQQAIEIINKIAKVVGIQASELGLLLGIDIATGQPLLSQ
jgi:hypothetical protein